MQGYAQDLLAVGPGTQHYSSMFHVLVNFFLYFFWWHATQLPNKLHWGLFILICECPVLDWVLSSQLFLTYLSHLPLPLGFYHSLSMYFPLLLTSWLAVLLGGWPPLFLPYSFLDLLSPDFLLLFFSLCLPTPPILSLAFLLAIQLFIRQIRCFKKAN